uniref:hypothetical protein n=1 Tax=Bifidobacterium longum TaxID=216816 RepID=UPI00226A75CD|nr:hypothetical protein [Bifidobacterium longum]
MERTDGHERHDGYPHDGNRNGVIRRYLPKRSRIEPSMAADVQAIVDEINNRPMGGCSATARRPRRSPTNC